MPKQVRTHECSPTPDQSEPQGRSLLSVSEAADLVGVHAVTIRRRIAEGDLTAYRMSKRVIRIKRSDVFALFHRIPTTGGNLCRQCGRVML